MNKKLKYHYPVGLTVEEQNVLLTSNPVPGINGTLPCTESHENIQISADFFSGNTENEAISMNRNLNILVTFSLLPALEINEYEVRMKGITDKAKKIQVENRITI